VFDLFYSRVHLTRAPAYNEKFIPQQKAIQIHGERVWDDVDAANKSAFNASRLQNSLVLVPTAEPQTTNSPPI
jgi:hypothetical protein